MNPPQPLCFFVYFVCFVVKNRIAYPELRLGGKDGDMLFAFCGNKIWKRKVRHHGMGALSP